MITLSLHLHVRQLNTVHTVHPERVDFANGVLAKRKSPLVAQTPVALQFLCSNPSALTRPSMTSPDSGGGRRHATGDQLNRRRIEAGSPRVARDSIQQVEDPLPPNCRGRAESGWRRAQRRGGGATLAGERRRQSHTVWLGDRTAWGTGPRAG